MHRARFNELFASSLSEKAYDTPFCNSRCIILCSIHILLLLLLLLLGRITCTQCIRGGLLLQNCRTWRGLCVCVFVSVLDTRISCAKNSWTDPMPFGWLMRAQGTMYKMGVKIGRIHSQPRWLTRWSFGLLSNRVEHLFLFWFVIVQFFKMAVVRHFGFVFMCLDHTQRIFGGLCDCKIRLELVQSVS